MSDWPVGAQVCLATLLAQTGAWLPAASVTLSPADAIFVRMGAKDHIMLGQSTFFVELAETAAMLASATPCVTHPACHACCLALGGGRAANAHSACGSITS